MSKSCADRFLPAVVVDEVVINGRNGCVSELVGAQPNLSGRYRADCRIGWARERAPSCRVFAWADIAPLKAGFERRWKRLIRRLRKYNCWRTGCRAILCQRGWDGPAGHYGEQKQHAKIRQVHRYLPNARVL